MVACCECDAAYCRLQPCPIDGEDEGDNAESCMACHNGAMRDDYGGPGLPDPHPFPGAARIPCTGCHGGDGRGAGKSRAHVPPPPSIGDRAQRAESALSSALAVTRAGVDRLWPDRYPSPDGREHSNLDYLQFVNPGNLAVVSAGRGCGADGCHLGEHADWVPRSLHGTTTGIFSSTRFKIGVDNQIADRRGHAASGDTLAESAPRTVVNAAFDAQAARIGRVPSLIEQPERAQRDGVMRQSGDYRSGALAADVIDSARDPDAPNRVEIGTALEHLIDAQINISCGDCHLWSAGTNDRYANFRSGGCSACHVEYGADGRYDGTDPNVVIDEPADPDGLVGGERPHVLQHRIRNVAKVLPDGSFARGISDMACVGCHRGGNRTVLQTWGIRVDLGADVARGTQYPAAPDDYATTARDPRVFSPAAGNTTFNGHVAEELLLFEDYDGDRRDDTPPDIHYAAGMGCIDCHGSRDLHGGTDGDPSSGAIDSRQDQATAIRCQSCHGGLRAYATTAPCRTYEDDEAECAVDAEGNAIRHLTIDAQGHYWLRSRVTGQLHYVPQTRDVAVRSDRVHPLRGDALFNAKASFAMGRADGNPQTGTGPFQLDPRRMGVGFSHLDQLACATCHAAWTNTCIGCHLGAEYDDSEANTTLSPITGERLLLRESRRDAVYTSPVMTYLGVDSRGRIARMSPAPKMFWQYRDLNGDPSGVFAFSDRLGEGNNPGRRGRNDFPALGLNPMAPHSIRGRADASNEGPLYCVACHLNDAMMADADTMAEYDAFAAAYENQDFASIDFGVLMEHIGTNTGNQRNSPFYVRMIAGLGTGLFLFDADGCPTNALDGDDARAGCASRSPALRFADGPRVAFDLDRLVEFSGVPNASGAHPLLISDNIVRDGATRLGATNPRMAGPLGARTLRRLVGGDAIRRGLVLDAWLDANGDIAGAAGNFVQ